MSYEQSSRLMNFIFAQSSPCASSMSNNILSKTQSSKSKNCNKSSSHNIQFQSKKKKLHWNFIAFHFNSFQFQFFQDQVQHSATKSKVIVFLYVDICCEIGSSNIATVWMKQLFIADTLLEWFFFLFIRKKCLYVRRGTLDIKVQGGTTINFIKWNLV